MKPNKTIAILEKYVARFMLTPEYLESNLKDGSFELDFNDRLRAFLVYFQKHFYTRDKVVPLEINIPLNWFQAFKEEYFPKYLLKQFPIKYKTISKNYCFREVFPELVGNDKIKTIYTYDPINYDI
jgi:hypothetical protein